MRSIMVYNRDVRRPQVQIQNSLNLKISQKEVKVKLPEFNWGIYHWRKIMKNWLNFSFT